MHKLRPVPHRVSEVRPCASAASLWVPIIRSWALTRGFALHPGTRNRYEIRYTRTQHRPASRQVNDHGRVSGTQRLASYHVFTRYIRVTFFKGISLRPVPPGSGKDKDARWIDVHEDDLDADQMATWIRQAAVWVPIIRSWALTRGFALHPGTENRYMIRHTGTQHRPHRGRSTTTAESSAPTGLMNEYKHAA